MLVLVWMLKLGTVFLVFVVFVMRKVMALFSSLSVHFTYRTITNLIPAEREIQDHVDASMIPPLAHDDFCIVCQADVKSVKYTRVLCGASATGLSDHRLVRCKLVFFH